MNGVFLVALGGALGASLRYGVGLAAVRLLPGGWPWGTFCVNIIGSLAMGVLFGWLALKAGEGSEQARLLIGTGLLGGFTTFSAFSLEAANMMRAGDMGQAAGYVFVSVVLGVGALFVGLALAQKVFS
ncbi:MAG: fluoride efflux transporter CrcB [Hyphomonadaceae bacterium]